MHLIAVEFVKNHLLSASSHSKRRTHRFALRPPQPFVSSVGEYHNTRASSMPVRIARRHPYCEFLRRRPTRIALAPVLAFAEWQFHGRYPELLRLLVKCCCRMFCCRNALGLMIGVYSVGTNVRNDINIVWELCDCRATEVVRFSGPNTTVITDVAE